MSSYNMYNSAINKQHSRTFQLPNNKMKIVNRYFINKTSSEFKNLYSRGYNIHDIYYDGDSEVYTQPEFKTCELKNTKSEIEILMSNGYSVYDVYYDSNE